MNIKLEYAYMIANRAAAPASFFFALIISQRVLSDDNFNILLMIYAVCQWCVTSLFQWQKNAIISYYSCTNIEKVAVLSFVISSILSFFFIYISLSYVNLDIYLFAPIYVIGVGAIFSFGSLYRMHVDTKKFIVIETISQVSRWGIFIFTCFLFNNLNFAFGFSGLFLIFTSIFFIDAARKNIASGVKSGEISYYSFLSTGIWFAIFDFSNSGFMYVDRIRVGDTGYILSSTIGNQICSILFGALVSVAFPRLAKIKSEGSDWKKYYIRSMKYLPFIFIVTIAVSVAIGPFAQKIIDPGSDPSIYLLFLHTMSQGFQMTVAVILVSLRFCGVLRLASVFYAVMILIYFLTMKNLPDSLGLSDFAICRLAFSFFICISMYLISIRAMRS